jgi:peptidylprolyl isomerase
MVMMRWLVAGEIGVQVIPGLDEGVRTMQPGGLRRLYIPGDMAFPKGLRAAAGR